MVGELLADLQFQLAQRADRQGMDLAWAAAVGDAAAHPIGARQGTVLASICSELLRNAMQHPRASQTTFALRIASGQFTLTATNNGILTEPSQWRAGLGTTSIRRRINDLQGQCHWQAQTGGGVVFEAQWPLDAWLHGETGEFVATPP
jgi:signal transduction histidine kinase